MTETAADGSPSDQPEDASGHDRSGGLWCVADCLNVVAVGVADEGAVVVGVVLGPHAWLVEHLSTGSHGGVEKGADGCSIRGGERDVGFAEPVAGIERTKPSRASAAPRTPWPHRSP
jgi:hypothetical protein